ncbi:chromatin assembly factor 1 subunit FSM [Iris pallida]|uniref:Chromatin assembly factor 1 subunit FSM n=1 Tax=Iris pallida TaxID=29817 RepID=A0AAX6HK84_IRIPA|nr:chromatin assembly factor 1 subunit FSM [Iris pallida]
MRSNGWKNIAKNKMKMDALNLQQALNLTINSKKITRTSSSKMRKRRISERDGDRVFEGDDLVSEEGSNINNESSSPRMKRVAHKSPTRKSSRIAQESRDANNVRDGNNVNEESTNPKMKKVAYGPTRKSSRILQNMEDVIAKGKRTMDPLLEPSFMKDVLRSPGTASQCYEDSDDDPVHNETKVLWRVVLLVGMLEARQAIERLG